MGLGLGLGLLQFRGIPPQVLLGFSLLLGNSPSIDLMGIVVSEIYGRCGGDMGEMWGRYRGDIGEI